MIGESRASLERAQPFGCEIWARVETGGKLSTRGEREIFLGVEWDGIRYLNIETIKVRV